MVDLNLKRWHLIVIVVAIVAALIVSTVIYTVYMQGSPKSAGTIDDPSNDVEISVGTEVPGMVDVVSASLGTNGNNLTFTITVRDTITLLGEGETAQWNVKAFLQNDVLQAYEISANMNSTGFSCYIVELGETNATVCSSTYNQKTLNIQAPVNDLQSANEVQWFVLTTYEKYSGGELVTSGSDFAPDIYLQTTILKG